MENRIGVYQILCTKNGKGYVGATNNLRHRKSQHFSWLKIGNHSNQKLQEDFNNYGRENFQFVVLEVLSSISNLLEKEQFWIDKLKPEYNAELKAGNSTSHVKRKDVREKTSRSVAELWKDPEYHQKHCKPRHWKNGIPNRKGVKLSEETKQKVREANLGAKNPNYGKPRPQSFLDKMQKTYSGVVAPDGTIYSPITGLKAFCVEHKLDSGQLSRVLNGKAKSHKGWTRV